MTKKYIIYGFGISGRKAAEFLQKENCEVIITQDDFESLKKLQTENPKFTFLPLDQISFDENSTIIFSPGIPLYFPKRHQILDICQKSGAKLICDIELFFNFNKEKNNFIGITGTNGKSTTTALTGFIFEQLNIKSEVGGNIGRGVFDLKQNQENFNYIFECSSYQLDLINDTRFNIACLLNITPDHIDRHGNFENYVAAKKRIFLNQKSGDFAVIDIDNEASKKVFDDLKNDPNFKSNLIAISAQKICDNGFSLINGKLTCTIKGNEFSAEVKSDFLKGNHNQLNMAFAFAISYLIKANKEKIIEAIAKFKGLKHRLEFVGQIENINFINDSKATNAQSSIHALKAFDNIYWIVGGVSKEGGINELQPFFNKVNKAYLIGESSAEFAEILQKNSVNFDKCDDLKTAIKKAFSDAKNNSLKKINILLSPACASFDQWRNFEERGDYFCKIFDELQKP